MAKRIGGVICLMCVALCALSAAAEREVVYIEDVRYFPQEENWTYRFEYSYPRLVPEDGDDVAAMMVNETMDTVVREMLELVMPMFSRADQMTRDGRVTVKQTWEVTANTPRIFSVLMTKRESVNGEEFVTLEGTTFDVGGEYAGEMLTLRGLVRVGDSSVQLGAAVMPLLWEDYLELAAGDAAMDEETFYDTVAPTLDFYADQDENAVFFFQPSLFGESYRGPHTRTLTPAELEELARGVPAEDLAE